MANPETKREELVQFEQSRNQLMSVSGQKQQFQLQAGAIQKALEELDKTSETKVYKAVGNILILSDVSQTKKELQESKETLDLRIKTLQKQEDILVQKLNQLRARIEGKPQDAMEETRLDSKETKKSKSK